MKILKMKKLLLLLLIIVFVLQSCENKTEKKITKNIQQTNNEKHMKISNMCNISCFRKKINK